MANTLANIGFQIETDRSYYNLRQQVTEFGQTIRAFGGTYFRWSPNEGVELWARIKPEGDIGHLHPHYAGETRISVALVEKRAYEDQKDVMADGFFVAYPNPQKGVGFVSEHFNLQYGDGTYSSYLPFVFDAPDFDRYADIQLPALVDVQITAFALNLCAFESEDYWIDRQIEWDTSGEDDPYLWSGETFVPSTMLFKRANSDEFPKPTALMCATVLDTELITNQATGLEFSWARILTVAGEMDLVVSPEKINGYMLEDAVLVGESYLSGHILGYSDSLF